MSDTIEAPPVDEAGVETPPEPPEKTIQELLDERDEKLKAHFQSWTGRRDKDFLEAIERKLEGMKPKEKPPEFNFEDPFPQIESHVKKILTMEQQREQSYLQSVVNTAGRIMESDDLFEDTELGNEVVAVIKSDIGKIKKNVDPETAAELLVSNALKKVFKARKTQKKTAFDGKSPTGEKLGTITPSAKTEKKVSLPKMSSLTEEMSKRWGYDPETLKRVLAE